MQLFIEKLIYGGDGLARTEEGRVYFVRQGVPGDTVLTVPFQQSGKTSRLDIESIVVPSEQRGEPKCSVFQSCGGCQWQHIKPQAQREWKQAIVQESLERLGGITNPPILPILGVGEESAQARNRVQWAVAVSDDDRVALGYQEGGQHRVVAFEQCTVISENMNQLASALKAWLLQNPQWAKQCSRFEVVESPDRKLLLILFLNSNASHLKQEGAFFAEALSQSIPTLIGVCLAFSNSAQKHLVWGQNHLSVTCRGKSYRLSAGSFFQTNYAGAHTIIETIEQWLPSQGQSLLDLYGGVGLFAIQFGSRFKRVVGIEENPVACDDAKFNLVFNQLNHAQWQCGDAEKQLLKTDDDFEVAIIDPPRLGCSPATLGVLNHKIQRQLIYVSCNPTTLARDLRLLIQEGGWRLEAVQPIDLFPHTYHVETAVHLTR